MKRLRKQKVKENEIKVYWGKLRGYDPSLVYDWQPSCNVTDGRFLMAVFDEKFEKEMEKRDYDITTLKFSIQKAK